MPTHTRLLIGCGYLGSRVAKLWRGSGDHTIATTRQDDITPAMIEAGVFSGQADVTKPETLKWMGDLPQLGGSPAESLLYSVGFDKQSGNDIQTVFAGGLSNVLEAIPPTIQRVIYISTTGVYGPSDGDWVDERTPPNPQRAGGHASLAAEQVLAAHPLGSRSVVLRLAGIYGPGRIPYLDKLRAGEPLAVPSEGWLNLIHVDDAAAIVLAAERWACENPPTQGPEVFCVSDGCPVVRGDYYREVARLIGAAEPEFVSPDADTPAAQRARSDKRINNRKMIEVLRVTLQYPTYREGLAAILGG